MDDFPIWSETGMEYEFEKRINEELEMINDILTTIAVVAIYFWAVDIINSI